MAAHTGTTLSLSGHLLILTVFFITTVPYSYCRSYGNVAFRRPATMSSRYDKSGDASLAVNGNTGTTFSGPGYTSDTTQWNCIHTAENDLDPFWEVDLVHTYTVQYITIFRRGTEPGRNRMSGTEVTVDGELCKRLTPTDYKDERIDLTCKPPLTGRRVRLSRHGPHGVEGPSINLCELQVWVCNPGHYGIRCEDTCSNHCRGGNSSCDFYGTCTYGCEDGWYLPTCRSQCGHCRDRSCDRHTGQCSPCLDNFSGPRCKECDATHYGDDCRMKCGHCEGRERCILSTGICPSGCALGWDPDTKCQKPCAAGKYGKNCAKVCSKGCVNDTCEPRYGDCTCRAGWDRTKRLCEKECDDGWYGENCSRRCGEGCRDVCDKVTGHCHCNHPWTTDKCDRRCDVGFYGPYCTDRCSEGCAADCDGKTGHCDCKPGWLLLDSKCETKCPKGSYGDNCNMTCGYCAGSSACEHDTGHCTHGCADGFTGDNCHDQVTEKLSEIWQIVIYASPGVGVAVAGACVVVICCVIRRRQSNVRISASLRPRQPLPPAIVHITHDENNDVDEDDDEPTYEVCGPRYATWSRTSRQNNKGAAVVIQNVSANHNYRNISRDNGRGTDIATQNVSANHNYQNISLANGRGSDFDTENVSANHNYQNISLANGRGSDFATENGSANHDYQNISRDNARASDFATENVLANHKYQNV